MKKICFLFILLPHLCIGQVNLNFGLKAYYPFSGNAKDESGNNNHPIFNNASLTPDRFGNSKSAYHFNGKNNYMKIPNSSSLNMGKKMSISLWLKPTNYYTGSCYNNMLLTKSATSTFPSNYYLRFADVYTGCDAPKTTSERFTGNNVIAATPFVKLNQWYNVVWTSNGVTESIYVNCELKGSVPADGVAFSNKFDMFFGCQNSAQYPYWLNGDLDEIRIYDRALSKEEILALCDNKPEISKPEYVKVKEKNKDILPSTKKQVDKPGTALVPSPLITTSNQGDLKAGFIKLSTYDNEQEILLKERKKEMTREVTVDSDSISVTLYDNGEIDGDSITLIYNDKVLTTHQRLTDKPLTFWIKIAPGNSRNELVMYAENLGSIPPNTALMVIYDGEKRYEVNIKSTEKTNGSVSFKLRE